MIRNVSYHNLYHGGYISGKGENRPMHTEVYCICCKQRVPAEMAKLTFKTGFYRNIPLGICQSCGKIEFNAYTYEVVCMPAPAY